MHNLFAAVWISHNQHYAIPQSNIWGCGSVIVLSHITKIKQWTSLCSPLQSRNEDKDCLCSKHLCVLFWILLSFSLISFSFVSLKSGSSGPTWLSRTWILLPSVKQPCRSTICGVNRAAVSRRWTVWPLGPLSITGQTKLESLGVLQVTVQNTQALCITSYQRPVCMGRSPGCAFRGKSRPCLHMDAPLHW